MDGRMTLRRILLQAAAPGMEPGHSHGSEAQNTTTASGTSATKPVFWIYIGVAAAVVLVLLFIVCIVCCCVAKRRLKLEKQRPHNEQTISEVLGGPQAATIIPYETLSEATNEFDPKQKVGEGRFGSVYRGEMPDGTEVAVRRLSLNSRQGKREFVKGVKSIMDLNHRNVVRLVGCCYTKTRLLAYEFVENGTLAQSLFDRRKTMDWRTRFEILLGTATGLAFLHEESQTIFAHGDIKAGNILLDKIMKPKIADFGLGNLFRNDQGEVKARNMTSVGYMSPEFAVRGQLSAKADVFSYGVLCLEVISGKTNTDINLLGTDMQHLLGWAWQLQDKRKPLDMVDPKLQDSYNVDQVMKVIGIALLSTQDAPSARPSMSRIVSMLKNQEALPPLPSRPEALQAIGLGQENISGNFSSSFVAAKKLTSKRWTTRKNKDASSSNTHSGIFNSGIFTSGYFK